MRARLATARARKNVDSCWFRAEMRGRARPRMHRLTRQHSEAFALRRASQVAHPWTGRLPTCGGPALTQRLQQFPVSRWKQQLSLEQSPDLLFREALVPKHARLDAMPDLLHELQIDRLSGSLAYLED